MGAATVPKFVRSLVLDFPDICPQFFLGNVSRQEGKKNCTQHDAARDTKKPRIARKAGKEERMGCLAGV